jgi:hypothetical protein
MALPVRKGYSGSGVSTTLTSSPTNSDTTFTVTAITNWPNVYPFFIVVDPGTAKEEKMKVTGVSSLTVTVVRGQDDTNAVSHNSGAICYPVFTAEEANEANDIASTMTTKGDIITTDGLDINRLAVGTNAHVLQADSTATNGIKWGTVVAAGLASDSVTTAKIANDAVTTVKILDANITTAKIANDAVTADKIVSGAVGTSELASASVTAAKVATEVAGSGLVGGAGDALAVNVDDSTIEIQSDALRVKDSGITTAKIADANVTNAKLDYTTVPQTTVSTSDPTGGKNGDIWVKVI